MIDIPIRVKDALKAGSYRKNWRMIVLPNAEDPEGFVIENNSIVKESVMIDERMCSGKQLKFGLCEGSSLEFQYFDHPNIQGRRIEAILEAEYEDADKILKWYQIPMGFFDVDACPMQFSTGIRKVTAFNKLKSDYLDEKANDEIVDLVKKGEIGSAGKASIDTILGNLLGEYAVEVDYIENPIEDVKIGGITSGYYSVLYYSDTYKKHIYVPNYAISFAIKDYNPLSYYRIRVDRKAIREKCIEMAGKYADVLVKNPNNPSVIDNLIDYTCSQTKMKEEHGSNAFNPPYAYIYDSTGKTPISNMYIADKSDIKKTDYFTNANVSGSFKIDMIFDYIYMEEEGSRDVQEVVLMKYKTQQKIDERRNELAQFVCDNIVIEKRDSSKMGSMQITTETAQAMPDVTLRDLQSAVFETSCQFGQLDRKTDLFSGVTLNHDRLLPADSLYPSDDLLPRSRSERSDPSAYEKLWTDSGQAYRFKDLIITYKAEENGQAVEKKLQRTINTHGNVNYNMSSNWLFKNLIWTADQVGEYADDMVEKLRDVSWIPFEMWCAGMPWIETGDEIEISNKEGTFTSYILSRQLKGIQNLHDTYINGELDIF